MVLSKPGKNNAELKRIQNWEKQRADKVENNKEFNKEIIRRLRIQNKKLIEQLFKLREEIKKTKINRTQILNHLNELQRLVNM